MADKGKMNLDPKAFEKIGQAGGRYVKKVRVETFGMTQEAFAGLLGIGCSTLRCWENGVNPVPEYVLRAVKVMAASPESALGSLGAAMALDPEDVLGWETGRTTTKQVREDAVAWMKADPERTMVMDLVDGLVEFEAKYRDLGYPKLSSTDLMLMALYVEVHRLRKDVRAMRDGTDDIED